MIFLKYKQPKAEYVQFQRLSFGLILLSAVLFGKIEFIYLYLALSSISFITTINYSPMTLLFKLLSYILGEPLFTTAPQYAHSYVVNRLAEIFEDVLRIIGGVVVVSLYSSFPLAAWMMVSVMAIAMLISSFFGFCLSSLVYIGYKKTLKKIGYSNE